MQNLKKIISEKYKCETDNLFVSEPEDLGYWSNLKKIENEQIIRDLTKFSCKEIIREKYKWLYEIIFSPKRTAGLELLKLCGNELCVDYGCMWGAISIGLAKMCAGVLGIDQTYHSLKFLQKRIKEEGLDNLILLNANLNNYIDLNELFDIAVINGVLEWIPEDGIIELQNYFGKSGKKKYSKKGTPGFKQRTFLKMAYNNLKKGGKLYLAIENRYDINCMLGQKDPHSNIRFTSIFPRILADIYSYFKLGRKYVCWLYSFEEIKNLLLETGFINIELYMAFPDYRFSERIIPYNRNLKQKEIEELLFPFVINSRYKKILCGIYKNFIFKFIRPNFFAPSIIAVGYK